MHNTHDKDKWRTAACSNMPRFWATPYPDVTIQGWYILDRNRADKPIALVTRSVLTGDLSCHWHDKEYWGCPFAVWQKAVETLTNTNGGTN